MAALSHSEKARLWLSARACLYRSLKPRNHAKPRPFPISLIFNPPSIPLLVFFKQFIERSAVSVVL